MTRNVSENRGKSADTQSHIKKVRFYFIICMLMYCTDDTCNFPMHNLLTDMVETLGGSTTLIRILNRLGICTSSDTLLRTIQHRVTERQNRGPEQECIPNTVTFISADNIDFIHSFAKVFCGNQLSSWHGTSIQAVQPLIANQPKNDPNHPPNMPSSTRGESSCNKYTSDDNSTPRHTECPMPITIPQLVGQKQ